MGRSFNLPLCLNLSQACAPYMELVGKWIYRGIIVDPYAEVSQLIILQHKMTTKKVFK